MSQVTPLDQNNKPVPSLSTLGWIYDANTKIDMLLAHFYLSDYNQTQLYIGNVSSITRIMQENGGELNKVISSIQETLSQYLSRYYDSANVEVRSKTDPAIDPRSRLDLEVIINITDKQKEYGYGRMLKMVDSKMQAIEKLNN
jgi:hypothetical protein